MKASRTSSRGSMDAIVRPPGSSVGMSFMEWTARSISPASRASSISFVKSPLPPASASGRSWMRSPVVLKVRTSTADASRPCAETRRCFTSLAWASASGDPRLPILILSACTRQSPDARPELTPVGPVAVIHARRSAKTQIARDGSRRRMSQQPANGCAATLVLGIESSCDETAAAVVLREGPAQGRLLSNVVRSQWEQHRQFEGVVAEIAARAHVECLDDIIREAVSGAGVALCDVDGIAVTAGPGLIGGLLVGLTTAKALALATEKPLIAVNHLEAHALTVGLTEGLPPPYLLLLVSGGHTQLLLVRDVGQYDRLGTTIDDALGEAFDKTAKLLGLGFPGGPAVERMAEEGDPRRFAFPRPMIGRDEPHFSFAGLKTAVRRQAMQLVP